MWRPQWISCRNGVWLTRMKPVTATWTTSGMTVSEKWRLNDLCCSLRAVPSRGTICRKDEAFLIEVIKDIYAGIGSIWVLIWRLIILIVSFLTCFFQSLSNNGPHMEILAYQIPVIVGKLCMKICVITDDGRLWRRRGASLGGRSMINWLHESFRYGKQQSANEIQMGAFMGSPHCSKHHTQ